MTALNVLKFTNSPVQDLELLSRKPLVVEFRVFEKTKIKPGCIITLIGMLL